MATIADARRLAKRAWPGEMVDLDVEAHADGSVVADMYAGPNTISIDAPTRRAALAGLCAALAVLNEENRSAHK